MAAFSWGRGEDGQLASGFRADAAPSLVSALSHKHVVAAAVGSGHSLLLAADGALWAAGRSDDGRCASGVPEWCVAPRRVHLVRDGEPAAADTPCSRRALAVAAGSYHSAVIDDVGGLWVSGSEAAGKLGLGAAALASPSPAALSFTPVPAFMPGLGRRVLQVACGSRHTVALVLEEALPQAVQVFSWGSAAAGALGLPPSLLPRPDPAMVGAPCVCTPTRVPAFVGLCVAQLAACGSHTLALTSAGTVWTWGEGLYGRCGSGSEADVLQPLELPQHLFGGGPVVHVAAGGFHSLAVTAAGAAYAWGGGEHGQLSMGVAANALLPQRIKSLADVCIVSATGGWSHSLWLDSEGGVWAAGDAGHSKLGLTPLQVDAAIAATIATRAAALAAYLGAGLPPPPPMPPVPRCVLIARPVTAFAGMRVSALVSYNEHSIALVGSTSGELWRDQCVALPTMPLFEDAWAKPAASSERLVMGPPRGAAASARAFASAAASPAVGGSVSSTCASRPVTFGVTCTSPRSKDAPGFDTLELDEGSYPGDDGEAPPGGDNEGSQGSLLEADVAATGGATGWQQPVTRHLYAETASLGAGSWAHVMSQHRHGAAERQPLPLQAFGGALRPRKPLCRGASLAHDLGALVDDASTADVAFVLDATQEGKERVHIYAHRILLTARSPVLAAIASSGGSGSGGAGGGLGGATPTGSPSASDPCCEAGAGGRGGLAAPSASPAPRAALVPLPHIAAAPLRALLHWVYTDALPPLSLEGALGVAALADFALLPRALELCDRAIAQGLSPAAAVGLLAAAAGREALDRAPPTLRERVVRYTARHFDAAARVVAFKELPREVILELVDLRGQGV